ncbi:MAG: GAF domain-containing sensor histidine kinase [Spongiibacteraceae bacterium]
MIEAGIPTNEEERLEKLRSLNILDTLEEQAYDDLTKLAAEICKVPIALVSLIDKDRQWFKSHYGLDARETPRCDAFCSHAILADDVFIVEDADNDARFFDNPLTTDEPLVKFYAGAPLIMSDNVRLGTLCVIANKPRSISATEIAALEALARQVVSQLELRLRVQDLQELDLVKNEFVSVVSHELRTPLTAIYGSLSLMLNNSVNPLAAAHQQLTDISHRNTERLLNIVNDILDIAKIESGQVEMNEEPLNLVAVVAQAVEMNAQYCRDCDTGIVFKAPTQDCINVSADEQRLLQVMTNFISNAAKFTCENDVIEVRVEQQDRYAVVQVTDHGPGIPVEQHGLVFIKFKQLGTTPSNKSPGTGLGLNISKAIIELHQGVVGFDSTPNEATTFYFKLLLI